MSGLLVKNQEWQNILASIGTSILATSIVSSVIRLSLGDPTETLVNGLNDTKASLEKVLMDNIKIIEKSNKIGLVSLWAARQDLSTEAWIERLRSAKSKIKLLAYAMAFLPDHPDFVDILEDRLLVGCKVYINVGDPNSLDVASREMEEHENIVPRINTTINRIRRLIGKNGFHLRIHAAPLYCSVYLFDDEMFVTPHLFGIRGAAAPLLQIRRTPNGLFLKYERHFDDLWSASTDLT